MIDSYSCFGENGEDTGLDKKLKDLNIKNVYCCGMFLDGGTGATAEDADRKGYRSFLVKDCSKSMAADSEKAMFKFK